MPPRVIQNTNLTINKNKSNKDDLEHRINKLYLEVGNYIFFLKNNPLVMLKYNMNFDFKELLRKCKQPNYTLYTFLSECEFEIQIINSDMSTQQIKSNCKIPGENQGAKIEYFYDFFWRMKFKDNEDFETRMSQYKMINIIEFYSRISGKDFWTAALFSASSRGNPYIVKIS